MTTGPTPGQRWNGLTQAEWYEQTVCCYCTKPLAKPPVLAVTDGAHLLGYAHKDCAVTMLQRVERYRERKERRAAWLFIGICFAAAASGWWMEPANVARLFAVLVVVWTVVYRDVLLLRLWAWRNRRARRYWRRRL